MTYVSVLITISTTVQCINELLVHILGAAYSSGSLSISKRTAQILQIRITRMTKDLTRVSMQGIRKTSALWAIKKN